MSRARADRLRRRAGALRAARRLGAETLLAPLGRRAAVTRDPAQAGGAALAYAPAPVPGVPTIPCDAGAVELLSPGRPLPGRRVRRPRQHADLVVTAWPADRGGRLRRPGRPRRLRLRPARLLGRAHHGGARQARPPALHGQHLRDPAGAAIEDPAVDRYVDDLRTVLAPRLAALGLEPLPEPGWVWGPTASAFAVALTHDVDNLWRWTPARRGRHGLPDAPCRACPQHVHGVQPRARRLLRLPAPPPAQRHGPVLDVPPDPRPARTSAASRRPST